MLRSEVQKQGSFYVFASCRRQNRHSLTQLRSRAPTPARTPLSTSRLFSGAGHTLYRPRAAPEPRNVAPPETHHGPFSRAASMGGRGYSSFGRFGSGTLPGQTNSDWVRATPKVPGGQSTSSAWGGKGPVAFKAGKIPPAKSTTSTPHSNPAVEEKKAPPSEYVSEHATSKLISPHPVPEQPFRPPPRLADKPGKDPIWPPRATTPDTATATSVQSSISPQQHIELAASGEGATGDGRFPRSWSTVLLNPASRASRIPGLSGRGTMGNFKSEPKPLSEETSTVRDAPRILSSVPGLQSQPGDQDPDPQTVSTTTRQTSRPPSLPPGAEYPMLRRRPNVDEFEALNPFKLDDISRPSLPSSSELPLDPQPTSSYRQPPRKPPSGIHRSDSYPNWGKPSSFGESAPAPVDIVANSRMGTPSTLGSAAGNPSEAVQGLSGTPQTQKPVSIPPSQPAKELPVQTPSSQVSSEITTPVEQFSSMQGTAQAHQVTKKSMVTESDWGLSESDLASPGTQYAQRLRETSQNRPQNPEQEWAGRPVARERGRDRETGYDRDQQRRDRGRASERFDDRPKKKRSYRVRDHDDDHEDDFDFEEHKARKEAIKRRKEEKRAAKEASAPKTILLPEYITVFDLAQALGVRPQQFLDDLGELGFENILHDSIMTGETAALVAAEYGLEPTIDTGENVDLKPRPQPEDPSALPPRPPIVTIMGHVDHGKTTMLDWLRKSSVAAQEHGGITQHIGAFSVRLSSGKGKVITFLDTPGHAAFLSMRQRGANVTDIVVLVVAVDDGVKPQTLEALKHAQNARVPIIVAINKIDKDEFRIGKVKEELAGNGVEIEDFGGDVQVVAVSAKTGQGMNDLEESILTLSEILDVRAEMDGMAEGWILEASVKVDGKAATVLVKRGTMRVGDVIVAGTTYARIRIMRNEAGADILEAGPGTPVEVFGWRDSPMAGDMVLQAPDEDKAHAAVEYRQELAERAKSAAQKGEEEQKNREKAEQEELDKMMAEDDGDKTVSPEAEATGPKIINLIVKGDVMGSVEAVCNAVAEIGNNEVQARILQSSPGQINESDVDLMATAKGCIINFNSSIPSHIERAAEEQGVRILNHTIIYHLVDDVKAMMSEQLQPIISQRVLAEAEVLQLFAINIVKRKYKNVAGVRVRNGILTRGGLYRVMRKGEKVYEGKLYAMKQGKKDVKEMRKDTECGLSFEDWDDLQPGDIIQLFEEVQEKRYL